MNAICKGITALLKLFVLTVMACLVWIAWEIGNIFALMGWVAAAGILVLYLDAESKISQILEEYEEAE